MKKIKPQNEHETHTLIKATVNDSYDIVVVVNGRDSLTSWVVCH